MRNVGKKRHTNFKVRNAESHISQVSMNAILMPGDRFNAGLITTSLLAMKL